MGTHYLGERRIIEVSHAQIPQAEILGLLLESFDRGRLRLRRGVALGDGGRFCGPR